MTRLASCFLAVMTIAAAASAQSRYPQPADLQTYYIYFLNKGPNHGGGTADERKAIQAGPSDSRCAMCPA